MISAQIAWVSLIRNAVAGTPLNLARATPGQQHLPSTLLRLGVGCENVEDLWSDLDSALGA